VRVKPALRVLAVLLALALVLAGCGGGDDEKSEPKADPSPTVPTGNVEVADGVTITEPGTELDFGAAATVAYEPNPRRGSVLSLAVSSVRQGRISDFAAYQVDAATKKSRPYYVRGVVKNVGPGDMSRVGVPLYAVSNSDTLIQPSTFNNTFTRCPSKPLPAGFVEGKSTAVCLVYLIPNGGTLTEVSYRPLQAYSPITWSGAIQPPVVVKKKAKSKRQQRN